MGYTANMRKRDMTDEDWVDRKYGKRKVYP